MRAPVGFERSSLLAFRIPPALNPLMKLGGLIPALAILVLPISVFAQEKPPFVISPGKDWGAYDHHLGIEKDGIFDFSFLADAPAGKYGALKTTEAGHFEFAERPGVRAKFWGANLCFTANYLTKENADKAAIPHFRSRKYVTMKGLSGALRSLWSIPSEISSVARSRSCRNPKEDPRFKCKLPGKPNISD